MTQLRLLILLALLAIASPAIAQNTLVSATINDAGGQAWVSGTYTFTSEAYPSIAIISGTLDATGSFTSVSFPTNNVTAGVGGRWRARICPAVTAPCYGVSVSIPGGSTLNLTSALTPPAIAIPALQPPPITAYIDAEIINAAQGNFYYNVIDNTEHVCKALPCSSNWQSVPNSGANNPSLINKIIHVDGTTYTKNDAGVQAALTALHAQGGGRLYLDDGTYSTLTTTISLNCKEELFIGVMNPTYTLTSTASPMINMTGAGNSPPDCGTAVRGINRFTSSITGNGGATADVINVAASCNGCTIENLRITGISTSSRDTIRIQDNQRNLTIQHLQLGPNAECINYIPGGTGFNIITIEDVRCDGWTGSGMDFRLNGNANGTNLRFVGGYLANGLSSPVSYDVNGLQASFENTSEDHNVANAIGIRIGTTATNRGCYELRNVQVEGSSLASQTGIQISGASCTVMVSPYINADGTPISITAASTITTIISPETSNTVNSNSIVYGAAVTGQHVLIGTSLLDKVALNSSAVILEEHAPTYTSQSGFFGIGISNFAAPTFPLEINQSGTGNSLMGFDRAGAFKWRVGNEGAANGVCGLSAQDDFCIRGAAGTVNFSTDGGTTDALRVNNTNLTIQGAPIPRTAASVDIGSTSLPWANLWLGTAATNNFKFQPAATGQATTVSVLDPKAATSAISWQGGIPCTNGELALSAGWGTTATVTAVVGLGWSCEWTVTSSGTGQAASPTITDTLVLPVLSASIACEMRMVGGTGTATLIDQTTLSATAPVFTFGGTPVAASTYKVYRRC